MFERALDRDLEQVCLDRLRDEIVRAGADRSDCTLETDDTGQHDDQQVRMPDGELAAELDAGHSGIWMSVTTTSATPARRYSRH